jgi:nucleoside-diphosphate-sugar epimerase
VNIVVTGASGLIGRHLAAELDAYGHAVLCVDRDPADSSPGRFVKADLTDIEQVEGALRGADAVVHLARIPFPYTASGYDAITQTWRKPDHTSDADRFNLNLAMTYNTLAAASAAGVRKMVMGSSFAVYGLYYPSRPLMPEYVPIDESHPRKPDDPYGLTKLLGEQLADAWAKKGTIQIASLRFPGVSRETLESIPERESNPMARGIGGLWTYVDARDAATACRLALEADFAGHEAFNICAPKTFIKTPTHELLERYLAKVPRPRKSFEATWAGYDSSKAQRMLGFQARHLLIP